MAWFKMDAGAFITDTSGVSNAHAGIYCKLMCMYWQQGNSLAIQPHVLKRRLGITNPEEEAIFTQVLSEHFTNDDGEYRHINLDTQLQDVKDFSNQQSIRASKPRQSQNPSNQRSINTYDDTDF